MDGWGDRGMEGGRGDGMLRSIHRPTHTKELRTE